MSDAEDFVARISAYLMAFAFCIALVGIVGFGPVIPPWATAALIALVFTAGLVSLGLAFGYAATR